MYVLRSQNTKIKKKETESSSPEFWEGELYCNRHSAYKIKLKPDISTIQVDDRKRSIL